MFCIDCIFFYWPCQKLPKGTLLFGIIPESVLEEYKKTAARIQAAVLRLNYARKKRPQWHHAKKKRPFWHYLIFLASI